MLLIIAIIMIAIILGIYYYTVVLEGNPIKEKIGIIIKYVTVSVIVTIIAIVLITKGITFYITVEGIDNNAGISNQKEQTDTNNTGEINNNNTSDGKIGVYTIDKEKTKQLKEYLKANYANAEWYSYIKDIKVVTYNRHYSAFIYTNLDNNDANVNEQLKILQPAYDIIHNWNRIVWIYVNDKYNYPLYSNYDDKVLDERIQDQIKAGD